MDKLIELIKSVCGNNIGVTAKGVLLPGDAINATLLTQHREEINQLCVANNLRLSTLPTKYGDDPDKPNSMFLMKASEDVTEKAISVLS